MTQSVIPQKLDQAMIAYEELQKLHIAAFTSGNNPDLTKLTFEREKIFLTLQTQLNETLKQVNRKQGTSNTIAVAVKDRLAKIMEKDDILAEKTKQFRETITSRLSHMQHGKKALEGYGRAQTNRPPRFVSNRE